MISKEEFQKILEEDFDIILESVGDADNIIARISVLYAHMMKMAYNPAAMKPGWVNTIWNQTKYLVKRCTSSSEWRKAESRFNEVEENACNIYLEDHNYDALGALNKVKKNWSSVSQFRNNSSNIRNYIAQLALNANNNEIHQYILNKDWVNFA